ncbi:MAG: ankyrin repeat domain-containing protein [Rhodobacteraceae bacterium]|nr:ankyrin repeat domain-containing protein [Paracoccaceae bacterium]
MQIIYGIIVVLILATGLTSTSVYAGPDCRGWTEMGKGWSWVGRTADDLITCLRNHDGYLPQEILYRVGFESFLEDERASATRALLAAGLDPNGKIWKVWPLHSWANAGWGGPSSKKPRRSEIAHNAQLRAFLEAGADPNIALQDGYVSTAKTLLPVLIAGFYDETPPRWERLRAGMPSEMINYPPGQGWRPLHMAALALFGLDSIRMLLEAGADMNLTIARGQDWTALHVAAYVARPGVVELLLEYGADPQAVTTERDWTPLHGLAWSGGGGTHNFLDSARTTDLLLKAGVDPSAKDARGRTAWDIIQQRHGKRVRELLDAGELPSETRAALAALQKADKG